MDRNLWWGVRKAVGSLSLSARRAWIEILSMGLDGRFKLVALRKESVDRNCYFSSGLSCIDCRSPQGERG